MSAATERAYFNLFHEPIVKYAGGSGPHVLDTRFVTGFTPWFGAGSHSIQECDEDGNTLPGSSSAALAAGTEVTPISPFYLVTVDAGNDLEITRVGSG